MRGHMPESDSPATLSEGGRGGMLKMVSDQECWEPLIEGPDRAVALILTPNPLIQSHNPAP